MINFLKCGKSANSTTSFPHSVPVAPSAPISTSVKIKLSFQSLVNFNHKSRRKGEERKIKKLQQGMESALFTAAIGAFFGASAMRFVMNSSGGSAPSMPLQVQARHGRLLGPLKTAEPETKVKAVTTTQSTVQTTEGLDTNYVPPVRTFSPRIQSQKWRNSIRTMCHMYGRSRHEFSRKSGVIRIRTGYATEWYANSMLHREEDLPAIEHSNGDREWFYEGLRHRENDLPAIVDVNGAREWYLRGSLHRDVAGRGVWILPAVELANGDKQWWVHGCRIGSSCTRIPVIYELALPSLGRNIKTTIGNQ